MPEPPEVEVTEEDLRKLDSEYEPFRGVDAWPDAVSRPDLWDHSVASIERTRAEAAPDELERALEFVVRAAALDTGAIENLYSVDRGFTITVAAQATAWQAQLEERGANARALFEAQLKTYELVLDVATKQQSVSEAWIRRVHEELTTPQETYVVHTAVGSQEQELPRGVYKQHPNHVLQRDGNFHVYAPVTATPREMHRLVEELASQKFNALHPVIQAAYAHHALTAIHPFADGNGRVARAVASVYSYRAASVPLLIFADRRFEYFDALQSADLGDTRPLVRFFFDAGITAMNLVTENARTARAPDAHDAFRNLQVLLTAQGGLTHQELDQVANNFINSVVTIMNQQAEELERPPGVDLRIGVTGLRADPRPGFREIVSGSSNHSVQIAMSTQAPAGASGRKIFSFLVSQSRDESETLLLLSIDTNEELRFALRDVYPELNAATEQRIRALAMRALGYLASELEAGATASLHESGYH